MGRKPKAKTRRTGQGSVYQRKDGRWAGAITVGYNENGNPKRVEVIKASRDDAVDELNKIITRLSLGVPPKDDGRTVAEYLNHWLEETVKPHREPKTYRSYEQSVRLHLIPHIGHLTLRKLTASHVQALWNRLSTEGGVPDKADKEKKPKPLSPATVHNAKAALRRALNVAQKQRLIAANPTLMTETPKVVHAEPVYLSQEEVASLLKAAAKDPLGNIVSLALMTGLRLGEATGLAWDDVDLEAPSLRVRMQLQRVEGKLIRKEAKSRSSRRTLSLATSALAALQDQKAQQMLWKAKLEEKREATNKKRAARSEELLPAKPFNEMGLVFTMTDGLPLDPKTVHDALARMCAAAEITKPISFHKLRHTAATHMAASGVPLVVLKDVLGHSQISLTANTYSHAVPAALKEATDALERAYQPKPKAPTEDRQS
jgi:integrase